MKIINFEEINKTQIIHLKSIDDAMNIGLELESYSPRISEWGWDYYFIARADHLISSHKHYGNHFEWEYSTCTSKVYRDENICVIKFIEKEAMDEDDLNNTEYYEDVKTVIFTYSEDLYNKICAAYNFRHLFDGIIGEHEYYLWLNSQKENGFNESVEDLEEIEVIEL